MAKQRAKTSAKKDAQSRKMRDLPAKSLGVRKAASVKGGTKAAAGQEPYLKITLKDVLISG